MSRPAARAASGRRRGRPPNPEPSVLVTIHLPPALYARLIGHARASGLTVSAVIRDVLEQHGPRRQA